MGQYLFKFLMFHSKQIKTAFNNQIDNLIKTEISEEIVSVIKKSSKINQFTHALIFIAQINQTKM